MILSQKTVIQNLIDMGQLNRITWLLRVRRKRYCVDKCLKKISDHVKLGPDLCDVSLEKCDVPVGVLCDCPRSHCVDSVFVNELCNVVAW